MVMIGDAFGYSGMPCVNLAVQVQAGDRFGDGCSAGEVEKFRVFGRVEGFFYRAIDEFPKVIPVFLPGCDVLICAPSFAHKLSE